MLAVWLAAAFAADPPGAEFFETRVRPVLVENCQKCHGAKKQEGGLRLDSRAALLKGGESGPALVPGDPAKSRLLQAIRHSPDLSPMPPESKPMPAATVEAIASWVKEGAVWPESAGYAAGSDVAAAAKKHWAFQPIADPKPPAVKNESLVQTPIDRFLLAALEAKGLSYAAPADRATLIRRASFDLVGLPPTPEEVKAFIDDPVPTPAAFAKVVERLLDSKHYGERWGRHWLDVARYADTKGYVFQEERKYPFAYTYRDWTIKAFNDDMPFDRFVKSQLAGDKLAAKGDKNGLAGMGYLTVGRRFLQDNNEIIDDRIDVVSRGLLGLTVSCARCHDHKFDPIPSADYYSLYGVFASSHEPKDLPVLASAPADEAVRRDFEKKEAERRAVFDKFVAEQIEAVRKRLHGQAKDLLELALATDGKTDHPKFGELAKARNLNERMLRGWLNRWNQTIQLARQAKDPALEPWFRLASAKPAEFAAAARKLATDLKAARRDGSLGGAFQTPVADRADLAKRYAALIEKSPSSPDVRKALARFFDGTGPFAVNAENVQQLLDRPARNKFVEMKKNVDELSANHPGAAPRAMVMMDNDRPMQPRVFLRGNPGRPGPQVPRQFLAVVGGDKRAPFKDGSGRLELAEAIVDPANPLTARVYVNRVWAYRFGRGLASTPSDFGLRSDPPSHPELLDYLARQFVANGWSTKKLHRLMMNSRAYQQASVGDARLAQVDPENKLLGKFPRQRLDWESLRDAMLAVGGNLDRAIGGRAVELFSAKAAVRRTVYGFVDRQNLDPAYRTFDFATPDATNPQRFVTIVPQQGLFLLNHSFSLEQAKLAAARPEVGAAPDDGARIDRLYALLFARKPTDDEANLGKRFLSDKSAAAGASTLERYVHALLLTNEFTYVD